MCSADDLAFLRRLAYTATHDGPEKWYANQQLLTWFRSNPEHVIESLQAARSALDRPGGLTHTRLRQAIDSLPTLKEHE